MRDELVSYGLSVDVAVCLSTLYQKEQIEESDNAWVTYQD